MSLIRFCSWDAVMCNCNGIGNVVKEFSTDSFRCVFEQVCFIWFVSHTTVNEKENKALFCVNL